MTIRNITTRIGAALALGILGLTQAESLANSYAFHYTFGDGTTINGTLDGTPNGDIVEDVMNVHYKVNGIVGPDARDSEWVNYVSFYPHVSFSGTSMDLLVSDAWITVGIGFDSSDYYGYDASIVFPFVAITHDDHFLIGNWSLSQVCSTPLITVNVYDGFTFSGGGAPYSGLIGTLTASDVQFATANSYNWHPFGLGSFGADITGSLDVAAAGTYSFTLDSDDGSLLFIDGLLVVDDGNAHPPQIGTGSATLTAGTHSFEVQFFECCGGPSGVDLTLPAGVTYGCPPDCAITCTDVTASNDPGQCSAVVNYPAPTTTGDCTGWNSFCVPASGSVFPVGTTVVSCLASNSSSGASSSCTFTVTVNDTEAPVASCVALAPPNAVKNPLRIVSRMKLVASDNCDSDPKIYINDSASGFVAGPFHNNDKVVIARGPGLTPSQRPGNAGYVAEISLKGDALIWAADASGNASPPVKCK